MRIRLRGFGQSTHPPPTPTLSRGTAVIEGPVLPQEKIIFFPPSSSLLIYTSPSSSFPSLSFFNQPFWHPEWVHHFIKEASAQTNSGSYVFSSAPRGSRRCPYGRQGARHSTGSTPREVQLSHDWTLTLKHVYVNLWQGEGSGQMSRQGVDLQTPDPSSEIEGQSKTCVPVLLLGCLSC